MSTTKTNIRNLKRLSRNFFVCVCAPTRSQLINTRGKIFRIRFRKWITRKIKKKTFSLAPQGFHTTKTRLWVKRWQFAHDKLYQIHFLWKWVSITGCVMIQLQNSGSSNICIMHPSIQMTMASLRCLRKLSDQPEVEGWGGHENAGESFWTVHPTQSSRLFVWIQSLCDFTYKAEIFQQIYYEQQV